MRILVPTERFPSRIQPWLLNTVEKAVLRGAEVWLTSALPGAEDYPPKVDDHGLRDRTLTLELGSPRAALRGAVGLLGAGPASRRARAGLRAALDEARRRGSGLRGLANAVIKAPAFGLPPLDLVHSHALAQGYDYSDVSRHAGIPQVHTYHGAHLAGVSGLADHKRLAFFRHISVCLVNTDFARREVESLGCPPDIIRVLPQGIVLDEFPFRPTSPDSVRPLRLLTVGRLNVDKGQRFALEAVSLLAERGVDVDYRVVGDGPQRDALEGLASELGVGGRVHFTGRVDDATLREEYADADVFLLPSVKRDGHFHEETQGVVIQEAQASGCIVVATRTGGIPECVDEGVSAFLVDDRRPDQIADAVAQVAAQPDRWTEWQQRGRAWVESRYDMEAIGDRLWSIYRELVDGAGASSETNRTY
jgi:glycosyltransferase involved in cell wall biosynthesis